MRRTTTMRITAGLGLCLAVTIGLAGCGKGDGGEGVATANSDGAKSKSSSSSAAADGLTNKERALKFAQCMRDQGVPMQDPQFQGDGDEGGVAIGIGGENTGQVPDKEKIDAAQQACKQYMPNGGNAPKMSKEDVEKARKYSQCMRDNGISDFPDPQEDGGLTINSSQGSDLDPGSPKFKAADETCRQYMPGPKNGGRMQQHVESGDK